MLHWRRKEIEIGGWPELQFSADQIDHAIDIGRPGDGDVVEFCPEFGQRIGIIPLSLFARSQTNRDIGRRGTGLLLTIFMLDVHSFPRFWSSQYASPLRQNAI